MDNNNKEKLVKTTAIYGACLLIGFILLISYVVKYNGNFSLSISSFIDVLPGVLIFTGGLIGTVQSVTKLVK